MKHKYMIAGSAFIAFLFVISAIFVPQIGAANERATTENYVVESAHNYANNFDYTWTIQKSGAEWIKVHFYRLYTENRYDYVYLYDGSGNQIARYTGNDGYNFWSPQVTGDTVRIRLDTDYSVTAYGFKVDQIEYEAGSSGGDGEEVTDTFNGYVAGGETDWYSVDALPGLMSVSVSWSNSYDIDCYICTSQSTSSYLARGYTTSNPEDCSYNIQTEGTYYIGVKMYTSSASSTYYTCTVTYMSEGATPPPVDEEAPVVSITSPSNNDVVDGTVTVSIAATDNVGVDKYYLSIDGGSYFETGATYNWDTTPLADGDHTVKAAATDAAGNAGYSSTVTVEVDNVVEPPPADGDEHFIGSVAGGETDWYEIYAYAGAISVSVSWSGSYDIDCYISTTQSTTSYLARGYTTNNPETCSYTVSSAGTYYIGVKMYTSSAPSTQYDCHVTWQAEEPPPPPPPSGDKFALIVGISDYEAISDLSYCDEDATDWYNYLIDQGYGASNIRVLGDGHTSNFPAYYARADEINYKSCLDWLASVAASGNTVVFTTSGHGSGNGAGSSYLCAWDCNSGNSGEDGDFYDTELDNYIENIADNGAYVFVFIDHCYSGGMGPELMAIAHSSYVYCTTTCTEDGYGYDDPTHNNGMWTYWFLEAGLIGQGLTTMEAAFDWAAANYPKGGGDAPMEFDGNTGSSFTL